MWRLALVGGLVLTGLAGRPAAAEQPFDDPLWRQCVSWLFEGTRGALIENQCIEYYDIPTPGLFRCAREVRTGYRDATEREVCAILFEMWTKRIREGYVR